MDNNDPLADLEKELAVMGIEKDWPSLRDHIAQLVRPHKLTIQRHPITGRITHANVE